MEFVRAKNFARLYIFVISFFLVFSVTLYSFWSSENTEHLPSLTSQKISKEAHINSLQSDPRRQPSSLHEKFSSTLKFNCESFLINSSSATSASVSSDHVIFEFSHCAKFLNEFKTMRLTNLKNGYSGQLFKLNRSQLNSDFIQLDPGQNELQFEISLNGEQKRLVSLNIKRTP